MNERILAVKELFDNGINKELFFRLLLHVTDGGLNQSPAYANYLTIPEWKELFARDFVKINVSEEQIILFLNYMIKYFSYYFGKNVNIYAVSKEFTNDLRTEESQQFESIVYTTIQICQ